MASFEEDKIAKIDIILNILYTFKHVCFMDFYSLETFINTKLRILLTWDQHRDSFSNASANVLIGELNKAR